MRSDLAPAGSGRNAERACSRCKDPKPLAEFYEGAYQCKVCARAYEAERRARLFGPPTGKGKRRGPCGGRGIGPIDVGLAVLEVICPPGVHLSLREIADVCDCSPEAIHIIQKRAIKRARVALGRFGIDSWA